MKRYRVPKVKTGQLSARWGKLEGNSPDIVYSWGDETEKCDARLLHSVFSVERCRPGGFEGDPGPFVFTKSFVDELVERGYDITTFRFSIQKKAP